MASNREEGGPASGRPGEVRVPAAVALLVAAALYATLPSGLLAAPRFVVPALELVLLVPLLALNPLRMTREDRRLRVLALGLVALVLLSNLAAFVLLLRELTSGKAADGNELLVAALQVWVTNVIGFALLFWELDRGGPVSRSTLDRDDLPDADFRFSQDEDDDAVREIARRSSDKSDWRARFVDYLYVSITNSSAFSPTDTMPLSPRAKMAMSAEATQALLVSIVVIARGVSQLK